ncbi:hypothetical protein Ddye_000378 [Dipteronia dyeriana]|uniref:Uncharacterized protein n=1 Tax=Dipteronia dyeriana TaxID=168575 RepID=A0AAD9XLL1_9ROSI|nr:hypothetical protein Ddye_000378 [Dipteronia dyeriana]
MEATSSLTTNIKGGVIKFKNRRCSCGVKAVVKISESQNKPKKLYFISERGKYKFYKFWKPDNEEFNNVEYSESIMERNDCGDNFKLQQEMAVVNGRLQSLELLWERVQHLETNIHGRMHHLEYMQGGSKLISVVILVLFAVIMASVFVNARR